MIRQPDEIIPEKKPDENAKLNEIYDYSTMEIKARDGIQIENFKVMLPDELKDKLTNTKLMLGRKKELNSYYLDYRGMEKMMREYTVFNRKGKVDEIELTDNIFYRSKVPDHYFVPVEPRDIERDIYKNAAVSKIIKPILTQDQKTLLFEFTFEDLVEWDGIILKLKVENENLHNYIQIDGSPNKIIKSLKIMVNGEMIEEHTDW